MLKSRIADLFEVRHRFVRSTHLERDFQDPDALTGYLLTPPAKVAVERLARGLAPKSSQRAWRLTGDYGTGKSSFALALARLLTGDDAAVPADLLRAIDFPALGVERRRLLPVLVTGARERAATALMKGLSRSLEEGRTRGKRPQVLERVRAAAELPDGPRDEDAVGLLAEAAGFVRETGRADGILVVLDELGKFLEYAALHPERQDVYFLQTLAEVAARSGPVPILVVGILHQGFQAYSEQLSQPAQKEWEKVAGRYEEVLFNQPLDQAAALVASALNVQVKRLPQKVAEAAARDMKRAIEVGWYGPGAGESALREAAPKLYPLHPSLLPVLVRLFSRFGQNERSLYSFLLSDEPHALRGFAEQPAEPGRTFRVHHLYDYARAAFGVRLAVQSYRSHWNQIESVVESFPQDDELALNVLKTVAVLNLIDSPALVATADAVALAVAGADPAAGKRVAAKLTELQRGKAVLYFRGAAGGYCLWPHTSVNLDSAYQQAVRAIPVPQKVGAAIRTELETRPLVARRHYIETGNLRYFAVEYAPSDHLAEALGRETGGADGRILVSLCETAEEREEALRFAKSTALKARSDVLVAVPQPLKGLAKLLAEVDRWEWVNGNVPELAHDEFAREEVSRQLALARQMLEKRLRAYVGLRQFGEKTDLQWYYHGKPLGVRGGRDLLEQLTRVCDRVFEKAPRIQNELVNRHDPSSAAIAARHRLIDLLLTAADKPLLGMDPAKKPPEMSMYLSVLKAAGLHREEAGVLVVAEPPVGADPCNVRPVLGFILETLERRRGGRVRLTELFADLRRPPFGVRDGLAPFLLAVFAAAHQWDVAFYENGRFLRAVTGLEFQRLVKAPETFEVQYVELAGVRAVVFEKLFRTLNLGKERSGGADILDVVKPLCVFAAQLPVYTLRTSSVSADAGAVRQALGNAEEPAPLLFRHLPLALGVDPFESDDAPNAGRVKRYVEKLRAALDELGAVYPAFVRQMLADLRAAFACPEDVSGIRGAIGAAADGVLVSVTEPRLRAFCLRLADRALAEQQWIESVGSFVCSKPPAKWLDADAATFREELGHLARQFRRVESAAFPGRAGTPASAVRLALTRADGREVERVLYVGADEEERAKALESDLVRLLTAEARVGLAAATRALWRLLDEPGKKDGAG